MRKLLKFGRLLMYSFLRYLSRIEQSIGIILIIVGLLLIVIPGEIPLLTVYQSRTIGTTILAILVIVAAYKVWKNTDDELERLQAEKDSQKSNVELTNFCNELLYMTSRPQCGPPTIVVELVAILRNTSLQNSGSLDHFILSIPTDRGFFQAKCDELPLGFEFKPNSIYPKDHFKFIGVLSEPALGIESWEPFIKGATGRIILEVQGQDIKTYPVRIADKESL